MTSVHPEVITMHIPIDFYHHVFQYVETSLSEDLFVFSKRPSEAADPNMQTHIRRAQYMSQPAPGVRSIQTFI